MQLKILGSGTIKTSHKKNGSGYLIDDTFLLDCGPGIWRALGINNLKNEQIKYLAFSHVHADHASDLAPFLLERYLLPDSENRNLIIFGAPGFKAWFEKFSQVFCSWMENMPVEIREIYGKMNIGKYSIWAEETNHTEISICYRIEDEQGKSLFYSGDSGEHSNLYALSQDADLAIFEASNTEETQFELHLTPQLAAQIAQKSKVQKLVLTHFYPEVYHSKDLKQALQIFKDEVIIAEDNMTITL